MTTPKLIFNVSLYYGTAMLMNRQREILKNGKIASFLVGENVG